MKKISKELMRGMKPLPKKVVFDALDANDNEIKVEFNVLPFTVEEKAEIEVMRQDVQSYDSKSPEYQKATLEMSNKTMFFILRKTIEDFEEEDVEVMLSNEWKEILYWKAMEFEGITEEVKKKIMDGELTL